MVCVDGRRLLFPRGFRRSLSLRAPFDTNIMVYCPHGGASHLGNKVEPSLALVLVRFRYSDLIHLTAQSFEYLC